MNTLTQLFLIIHHFGFQGGQQDVLQRRCAMTLLTRPTLTSFGFFPAETPLVSALYLEGSSCPRTRCAPGPDPVMSAVRKAMEI
jgi:hypothetical protein